MSVLIYIDHTVNANCLNDNQDSSFDDSQILDSEET